jgi:hypothetical protein
VETNGAGGVQFAVGNGAATLWAGANATPPPAGWAAPMTYGFPLVALVYDPAAPLPTIQPTYAPQTYVADFGSNNTQIHGMIYSGGMLRSTPSSSMGPSSPSRSRHKAAPCTPTTDGTATTPRQRVSRSAAATRW